MEVRDPRNGSLQSLRAQDLSASLEICPEYAEARRQRDGSRAALLFIGRHAERFGLADPAGELAVLRNDGDGLGFQHVRLVQQFRGLPVLYAELIVHFDRDFRLYLLTGHYLPTPAMLDITPALTEASALTAAASAVPGAAPGCGGCSARLAVYPEEGHARLVFQVKVNPGMLNAATVLVDAATGKILKTLSDIQTGPGTRATPE